MTKKYKYHVHRLNIEAYEYEVLKDLEETELMMRGNAGINLAYLIFTQHLISLVI